MACKNFPFFASGPIISGFGRGSKDLGIPTANYSDDVVNSLPEAVQPGVYYGWAQVDDGPVYKMVMSIGWNPYFNNTKKSMLCLPGPHKVPDLNPGKIQTMLPGEFKLGSAAFSH